MIHFQQFETDDELAEWQLDNPEKRVHTITPILLETRIDQMSDTDIATRQTVNYGVMVTWSNSKTNGVGAHLKCISLLRNVVRAWEKSDDMVTPIREIKEALLSHREGNETDTEKHGRQQE
jgi:hypothetical protein